MLPLYVSALQTQKPVPEGTGYNPVVPPFWTPSVAPQGGPEAGETKDHRERTSQRWSGQPHTQQVRDPLRIRYPHPLTGVNRRRLLGLAAISPCNSRAHSTLPAGPGSQQQGFPFRVSPSPRLSGPAVERLLFPFAVFAVFGCLASYHGSAEVSSADRAWGAFARGPAQARGGARERVCAGPVAGADHGWGHGCTNTSASLGYSWLLLRLPSRLSLRGRAAPEAIARTLCRDCFTAFRLRSLCSLRSALALSAARRRLATTQGEQCPFAWVRYRPSPARRAARLPATRIV
jgi:hypothetical protein